MKIITQASSDIAMAEREDVSDDEVHLHAPGSIRPYQFDPLLRQRATADNMQQLQNSDSEDETESGDEQTNNDHPGQGMDNLAW